MTTRWVTRSGGGDTGAGLGTLGLEPLVMRFLASRGFAGADEARAYCDPRLTLLHEPALMPGLERACERLMLALERGERVVIYGDYDVDGICATAILFHGMRAIRPGADVRTYVPHRLDEGYGLHAEAMKQLAGEGARVVVSVDCGITGIEPALAAREMGLDLIITDHHNPREDGALPEAYAIVHPRVAGVDGAVYPFGDLCGAGVAFKLAWRMACVAEGSERVGPELRDVLLDGLALAGMATIADIVPLVGENRIIARHGLRRVPHTGLTGLRALIAASGLDGEAIDAERVGFILGPRLNACGRMGHAEEAVEMLTVADAARAMEIAHRLTKQNEERRGTERRIFEQADRMAESMGMTGPDRRAIVLADEGWHPGVVGIVCSRLVGKYCRPTILMQRNGGLCQGSGRSIDGFSLHGALCVCSDLLERFGGHDMAAGLAVREDALDAFVERFMEEAGRGVSDEMLVPSLDIDCEATLEELSPLAIRQLEGLGPFGRENPAPVVLLRGVSLVRGPEPFGAHGHHLKMHVRGRSRREVTLIGWRWGGRRESMRAGQVLDVVVKPQVSEWMGRVRVEPEIRDVRIAGG